MPALNDDLSKGLLQAYLDKMRALDNPDAANFDTSPVTIERGAISELLSIAIGSMDYGSGMLSEHQVRMLRYAASALGECPNAVTGGVDRRVRERLFAETPCPGLTDRKLVFAQPPGGGFYRYEATDEPGREISHLEHVCRGRP